MTKGRFVRSFLLLLALGFLGTILWSFWVDSLRPLIRQGNYVAAIAEMGGFLLVLAALGPMVYSAYLIIRDTRLLWANPHFQQKVYIVQHRKEFPAEVVRRTRWENLVSLWQVWRPALLWMGLGWGVLIVGSLLIRLAEGDLSK